MSETRGKGSFFRGTARMGISRLYLRILPDGKIAEQEMSPLRSFFSSESLLRESSIFIVI